VKFFGTYSFVHVAKGLNEAAYILAKTALVIDDVWFEKISLCILEIIASDL
jgi:hypothetical protein